MGSRTTARTWNPSSNNFLQTCEPMNPLAPVTATTEPMSIGGMILRFDRLDDRDSIATVCGSYFMLWWWVAVAAWRARHRRLRASHFCTALGQVSISDKYMFPHDDSQQTGTDHTGHRRKSRSRCPTAASVTDTVRTGLM